MKLIWELLVTFIKIGLFTFGGGYAMISVIEDICVEQKKWITHDEMMNITVIAESTPGPIAINCATFVGLKRGGLPGSVAATVGVVIPSFVIIYLISTVLDNFLEITLIANAFKGIKIGVGVLILNVAVNMLKKIPKKPLPRIITLCAIVAVLAGNFLSVKISTIALMLVAGVVGLFVFSVTEIRKGKGGAEK